MKASEVKGLTVAELDLKEGQLREGLLKLRFQKYTGELTNMAQIRKTRKDLARVMTELHSRKTDQVL
jgi:large subunit ribosomal protein L29